jgi:hypothetical protein
MLSVIKRYKPETNFILCGHYGQFLPVKDRVGDKSESYYKNSGVFHELTKSNMVKLTNCRRADDKHFRLCSDISNVQITDFKNEYCDKHICYTNKVRKQINSEMMIRKLAEANKVIDEHNEILAKRNKKANYNNRKPLKSYIKPLHLDAWQYSNNSQDVDLFVGVPIMSIKNIKDVMVNGESFVIVDYNDKIIKAKSALNDNVLDIDVKDFQRNFFVSYCITSHRAQGQTFKEPYTIHEWNRLNNRSKYVALSRADKWENCNISTNVYKHIPCEKPIVKSYEKPVIKIDLPEEKPIIITKIELPKVDDEEAKAEAKWQKQKEERDSFYEKLNDEKHQTAPKQVEKVEKQVENVTVLSSIQGVIYTVTDFVVQQLKHFQIRFSYFNEAIFFNIENKVDVRACYEQFIKAVAGVCKIGLNTKL